jgi:predicted transcriptional regulator
MDYNTLLSNRLKIILDEYFEGNYSEMARSIGVTEGSIVSYIKGKKKKDGEIRISTPSAEVINSLITKTGINSEWLISGVGEMKKSDKDINSDTKEEYQITQERLLKLIESQQRTIENLSKKIETK